MDFPLKNKGDAGLLKYLEKGAKALDLKQTGYLF